MNILKVLFGFTLFLSSFIVKATELYCELDANTPDEFTFHIPRVSYGILIKVEKGSVKSFSNESIKKVERYPLYYSIDFKGGGSAYLNRESLHLIYLNTSMTRAGLGGFYGNSRDAGADYKCRLVSKKI
jgi:hypothetical protein